MRPAAHELAGLNKAAQIESLDADGGSDPQNGQIVMISVGMSKTSMEFRRFIDLAEAEPTVNSNLTIIDGSIPGQVPQYWAGPNSPNWDILDSRQVSRGATPEQVQVAWVKQTRTGQGFFPNQAQAVQADLEQIKRRAIQI